MTNSPGAPPPGVTPSESGPVQCPKHPGEYGTLVAGTIYQCPEMHNFDISSQG